MENSFDTEQQRTITVYRVFARVVDISLTSLLAWLLKSIYYNRNDPYVKVLNNKSNWSVL